MGWLKNLWDNVTGWVHDNIVEPVVDWVNDLIEDTRTAIRIWKHEFHQLLAEWLENDWFFLAMVAATVALSILWPKIVTWAGKLSIIIVLKAAWVDVEDGLLSILDFIHIVELDAINTILKIMWPDWRAAMGQLSQAASLLATELGEGSAYFHAYFSVIHGLAIVENSFLGADARLAEMQAFEDTNQALVNVNDRFWTYAEDPSQALTDVIDEFYLPRAETIRTAQQDSIKQIRENRDRVVEINEALHDFDRRLEHFIQLTPIELQAVISDRLQPISDALSDVLFVMDTEIMPKINGVIDALALQSERQDTINQNIVDRMNDPYEVILNIELLNPEQQQQVKDYIAEMSGELAEAPYAAMAESFRVIEEGMTTAVEKTLLFEIPALPAVRPALSFEAPAREAVSIGPGWFQGEY